MNTFWLAQTPGVDDAVASAATGLRFWASWCSFFLGGFFFPRIRICAETHKGTMVGQSGVPLFALRGASFPLGAPARVPLMLRCVI